MICTDTVYQHNAPRGIEYQRSKDTSLVSRSTASLVSISLISPPVPSLINLYIESCVQTTTESKASNNGGVILVDACNGLGRLSGEISVHRCGLVVLLTRYKKFRRQLVVCRHKQPISTLESQL